MKLFFHQMRTPGLLSGILASRCRLNLVHAVSPGGHSATPKTEDRPTYGNPIDSSGSVISQ